MLPHIVHKRVQQLSGLQEIDVKTCSQVRDGDTGAIFGDASTCTARS